MIAAIALGATALIPATASAAPANKCADVKDLTRYETVFAIRATGTKCPTARRLATLTRNRATASPAPWTFRSNGFTCRGGWSWDQARGAKSAQSSTAGYRELSTGIDYAYWRCLRKGAKATFVRVINYGG
ncbi:hypothetical protein [Miltoncostaea oceani]|uniref:hypothetical protein n=1 Tax=Miltoncostaea oceani TaxID=2843216 RepID=UPI001C3C1FF6|nr:hypothetical protein [Miltoncostaea oceani]